MRKLTKSLGLTFFLVTTGVAGLVACGSDDDDNNATVTPDGGLDATFPDVTTVPTVDASEAGVPLSDGEIYQALHEANLGEISEAKIAIAGAQYPSIVAIATEFNSDHTSADQQLTAAANADNIVGVESDVSVTEETTLSTDEQEYQTLNGASLDYLYLRNQINAHTALLANIDTRFLPQVKDAGLKAQVLAAQAMVTMHLTQLQAIQADGGIPMDTEDGGGPLFDSGPNPGLDAGDAGDAADASDAADADAALL